MRAGHKESGKDLWVTVSTGAPVLCRTAAVGPRRCNVPCLGGTLLYRADPVAWSKDRGLHTVQFLHGSAAVTASARKGICKFHFRKQQSNIKVKSSVGDCVSSTRHAALTVSLPAARVELEAFGAPDPFCAVLCPLAARRTATSTAGHTDAR